MRLQKSCIVLVLATAFIIVLGIVGLWELTWDDTDTGQLKQVKLGGAAIAAGNLGSSPTTLSLNDDASKRTINNDDAKTLAFAFMDAPVADGYTVKLTFDVGCTRSASH